MVGNQRTTNNTRKRSDRWWLSSTVTYLGPSSRVYLCNFCKPQITRAAVHQSRGNATGLPCPRKLLIAVQSNPIHSRQCLRYQAIAVIAKNARKQREAISGGDGFWLPCPMIDSIKAMRHAVPPAFARLSMYFWQVRGRPFENTDKNNRIR